MGPLIDRRPAGEDSDEFLSDRAERPDLFPETVEESQHAREFLPIAMTPYYCKFLFQLLYEQSGSALPGNKKRLTRSALRNQP